MGGFLYRHKIHHGRFPVHFARAVGGILYTSLWITFIPVGGILYTRGRYPVHPWEVSCTPENLQAIERTGLKCSQNELNTIVLNTIDINTFPTE